MRAEDEAGLQTAELVLVTVDRTRPAGSLTAPASGADLRGANVGLAATASDTAPGTVNTVTFQRSPAGAGTWSDVAVDSSAPYTATFDTTAVADGLYDLRVFTTDAAGNAESTPATIQVRVDNTDPTGTITAPIDAADLRGTVALTSNSADAGSGVATVVFQRSPAGAGTWTNQAASWNTTLQTDGLYDLRVVTTDNAGNAFSSAPITVRVDNTAPTGAVTAPAGGANVRGTVALTSNSADAGSGVATTQFQRSPAGAGTWTNQAASWNTTLQADGLYDLRVVTTDNAGNSFTSGSVTVRVDNTAPTGSITAPANGAEIGISPVALTSNSADAGSGVATVVFERSPAGAGSWSPTPASWDTASGPNAVADGDYDLRVKTTDNAGNSFTSAAITVKVDHTAPTTSASVAPGSPSNAPITVTFSASDGTGSGVSATSYSIDGGSVQLGNSAIVAAPGDHSNDGSHVVQYFSTDDVGNVETPKTVTVVIDTTAPSGAPGDPGTFLRGIANLTYSTGAGDVSSVQFQFSPAGAGAWSNIGAADISPPYDAAWNTVLVADGPYDLRAVVTDTTGNVANELLPGLPKTVDNTAPSGSVTSPAAASFVSGTVNVTANASDGAAPPASGVSAVRFEIKPSGSGSFSVFGTQNAPVVGSTYQQSLVTSGFPDGPADLRVVVTDVAGNETTSAAVTVTFDNDAPVITLNDPGAAVSGTVTLGVSTSADTAQVVFERSPAGAGTWTAIATDSTPGDGFTAAFDTSALADGLYDLRARATDVGGNPGTSGTRTTRLDNTQPTGSITAPSAGSDRRRPRGAAHRGRRRQRLGRRLGRVRGEGIRRRRRSPGSAATATAPYTANWDSTSAPDGDAEIRAIDHRRRRQRPHDRDRHRHRRLDRTGRHPRRSRRRPLRHGRAHREHERRRHAGVVRRLTGRLRHMDGDRLRHELALRRRHRYERSGRRPLRPAGGRLRLARQRVDALRPGERPLRQHGPEPGLVRPRRRIGLDLGQPDPAHRQRAGDRAGRAARRRRRTCTERLRQRAHVRDRLPRRGPPRPLRRARRRQRQPHALPGRDHDREHPAGRPAAGGEVGVPDGDDDPRGGWASSPRCSCRRRRGRPSPGRRTSSSSTSTRSCLRPGSRRGSPPAAV